MTPYSPARSIGALVAFSGWDRLNDPYMEFFGEPLPARTALAVAALPRGARVEIEAWAVRPR